MKAISESDFQQLLKVASILTEVQTLDDMQSVEIAYNFWLYLDACRAKYKSLKNVYLPDE